MTAMDSDFDCIVLGTGLTESITAAALSKAGFKVAHLDTNPYYGRENASLTADEIVQWVDEHASNESPGFRKYTSIARSNDSIPHSRQYSLSLTPAIIPSIGPLISSLVSSDVARYGGYRLLEGVSVYTSTGTATSVPGSKEDVFKSANISLMEKRRIMRFLMFAVSDFESAPELEGKADMPFVEFLRSVFSLNEGMATTITFALAYCTFTSDPALPALQRLRSYLKSAGRYGSSPFLVGHYGGSGEIAQGFCRTAAVSGGVYILGRQIVSITQSSGPSAPGYTVKLDDFPEDLTCDLLIASPGMVPDHLKSNVRDIDPSIPSSTPTRLSIARCIAILDRPITFLPIPPPSTEANGDATQEQAEPLPRTVDTSVLVFPPATVEGGSHTAAATVLVTGEGSMSAPKDRRIMYISLPFTEEPAQSAEDLLRPYLRAALRLASHPSSPPLEPIFQLTYLEHPHPPISPSPSTESTPTPPILIPPSSSPLLASFSDTAATSAEALFWVAVRALKASPRAATRVRPTVGDDGDAAPLSFDDIDSFWPPLAPDPDADEEEDW